MLDILEKKLQEYINPATQAQQIESLRREKERQRREEIQKLLDEEEAIRKRTLEEEFKKKIEEEHALEIEKSIRLSNMGLMTEKKIKEMVQLSLEEISKIYQSEINQKILRIIEDERPSLTTRIEIAYTIETEKAEREKKIVEESAQMWERIYTETRDKYVKESQMELVEEIARHGKPITNFSQLSKVEQLIYNSHIDESLEKYRIKIEREALHIFNTQWKEKYINHYTPSLLEEPKMNVSSTIMKFERVISHEGTEYPGIYTITLNYGNSKERVQSYYVRQYSRGSMVAGKSRYTKVKMIPGALYSPDNRHLNPYNLAFNEDTQLAVHHIIPQHLISSLTAAVKRYPLLEGELTQITKMAGKRCDVLKPDYKSVGLYAPGNCIVGPIPQNRVEDTKSGLDHRALLIIEKYYNDPQQAERLRNFYYKLLPSAKDIEHMPENTYAQKVEKELALRTLDDRKFLQETFSKKTERELKLLIDEYRSCCFIRKNPYGLLTEENTINMDNYIWSLWNENEDAILPTLPEDSNLWKLGRHPVQDSELQPHYSYLRFGAGSPEYEASKTCIMNGRVKIHPCESIRDLYNELYKSDVEASEAYSKMRKFQKEKIADGNKLRSKYDSLRHKNDPAASEAKKVLDEHMKFKSSKEVEELIEAIEIANNNLHKAGLAVRKHYLYNDSQSQNARLLALQENMRISAFSSKEFEELTNKFTKNSNEEVSLDETSSLNIYIENQLKKVDDNLLQAINAKRIFFIEKDVKNLSYKEQKEYYSTLEQVEHLSKGLSLGSHKKVSDLEKVKINHLIKQYKEEFANRNGYETKVEGLNFTVFAVQMQRNTEMAGTLYAEIQSIPRWQQENYRKPDYFYTKVANKNSKLKLTENYSAKSKKLISLESSEANSSTEKSNTGNSAQEADMKPEQAAQYYVKVANMLKCIQFIEKGIPEMQSVIYASPAQNNLDSAGINTLRSLSSSPFSNTNIESHTSLEKLNSERKSQNYSRLSSSSQQRAANFCEARSLLQSTDFKSDSHADQASANLQQYL